MMDDILAIREIPNRHCCRTCIRLGKTSLFHLSRQISLCPFVNGVCKHRFGISVLDKFPQIHKHQFRRYARCRPAKPCFHFKTPRCNPAKPCFQSERPFRNLRNPVSFSKHPFAPPQNLVSISKPTFVTRDSRFQII